MAKKKDQDATQSKGRPWDSIPEIDELPDSVLVRFDDKQLLQAVHQYMAKIRHYRQMAIIFLLEKGLAAEGLWPPEEDPKE